MSENKKTAKTYGKVVVFPNNTNLAKCMENVKIPRNKHWYFISHKETDEFGTQLHVVKHNAEGVDCNQFVAQLKQTYIKTTTDDKTKKMFESISIVGNDKFSVIKNIPDIEIVDYVVEANGTKREVKKSLLSIITSDLIKLLKD